MNYFKKRIDEQKLEDEGEHTDVQMCQDIETLCENGLQASQGTGEEKKVHCFKKGLMKKT